MTKVWLPKKRLSRLSFLVCLLGLAVIAILFAREPQTPRQATYMADEGAPAIKIGGQFSLQTHTEQQVTPSDFADNYMLVYFGFTHCPHICPMSLQVMAEALAILEKADSRKAAAVQPILITVDPTRDTPKILRDYVTAFHPRLVGLTGSADEIKAVSDRYKIYAARMDDNAAPHGYTMDHSSFFYLMRPGGDFLTHFDHSLTPEKMAARLAEAIKL